MRCVAFKMRCPSCCSSRCCCFREMMLILISVCIPRQTQLEPRMLSILW